MTIREKEQAENTHSELGRLAIDGGSPVRTRPLPLEFPGIHHFGEEEVAAATAVLRDRSPFRYYGVKLRGEVEQFEKEFAAHLGIPYAVAVSSGTGALHTPHFRRWESGQGRRSSFRPICGWRWPPRW